MTHLTTPRPIRSILAFVLVVAGCGSSAESRWEPPAGIWEFDGRRSFAANEADMLASLTEATTEERLRVSATIAETFDVLRWRLVLRPDGTFRAESQVEGQPDATESTHGSWSMDGAKVTLTSSTDQGSAQQHSGTWSPEQLTVDWVTAGDARRMIFARGK